MIAPILSALSKTGIIVLSVEGAVALTLACVLGFLLYKTITAKKNARKK